MAGLIESKKLLSRSSTATDFDKAGMVPVKVLKRRNKMSNEGSFATTVMLPDSAFFARPSTDSLDSFPSDCGKVPAK
jgi:hypothetical protein